MGVTIIDDGLKIARFPKCQLAKVSHSLIKLIFFEKARFLSITETAGEITIVTEESTLKCIPQDNLEVIEEIWHALYVSVGAYESASGCGVTHIADSIILPFANAGISVYMLSSYQADYVLVRQGDLDSVINCLKPHYNIYSEKFGGEAKEVFSHSLPCSPPPSPRKKRSSLNIESSRPITHQLHVSKHRFYIASLTPEMLERNALLVLKSIFFSEFETDHTPDDTFFSFMIINHEVTLILNEEVLGTFPSDGILVDQQALKMIRVGSGNGLGFDECGIVAQLTEPIAGAGISEWYMSTFLYDHTLVPENTEKEVMALLMSSSKDLTASTESQ